MVQEIIKRNGIKYGIITGTTLSLITAIIYAVNLELFIAWWTTLLSFSIFIIIPSILLIDTKKALQGTLSFKEAFTTYFICALIGLLISVAFKAILFNIIDPSIKVSLLELTINYIKSTSGKFGVPETSLNEMISNLKKTDPFSITEQLKGAVVNLFFCGILGLIMAAFFKSKPSQNN
ncbi:DUF4199 domain-containing protein [Flavobacterium sp. UMI-01]|uniref:DUF4199 domain-containing protein n=1 Tax=Flavobacterium sp. UMI-01 TaxID=1441053 RepID=UPI001C7D5EE2|nr:DUF4199 domain-containing protein [Flavobacterium sp. UMI-01]GIZ09439.1 hypothetical protein FUMI01_21660 [Flavobacterium sp. UMI-01]